MHNTALTMRFTSLAKPKTKLYHKFRTGRDALVSTHASKTNSDDVQITQNEFSIQAVNAFLKPAINKDKITNC